MAGQFLPATSQPFGCFNVVIGAAAKTLAQLIGASIHADAKHMIIIPEDGDVRWTDDATVPTAAAGILLRQDTPLSMPNERSRMLALKFVRVGGADVNASLWIGG